jgi:hypothetical protein
MSLFTTDSAGFGLEGKTAAEKLHHYIAENSPKKAVDLLRNSTKSEVFNALARTQFSIVGHKKKDYIDSIQNDLLKACNERRSIAMIGY